MNETNHQSAEMDLNATYMKSTEFDVCRLTLEGEKGTNVS